MRKYVEAVLGKGGYIPTIFVNFPGTDEDVDMYQIMRWSSASMRQAKRRFIREIRGEIFARRSNREKC